MRLNVTWPEFRRLHDLAGEAERQGWRNAAQQAYHGLDEQAARLISSDGVRFFDEGLWLRGVEEIVGREVYEQLLRGPHPVELRAHHSLEGLSRVEVSNGD